MPVSSLFELPWQPLNMAQFSRGKNNFIFFIFQLRTNFQHLKQLIFWSDWPAGSVLGLETETSMEPCHCESPIFVFLRDDTNIWLTQLITGHLHYSCYFCSGEGKKDETFALPNYNCAGFFSQRKKLNSYTTIHHSTLHCSTQVCGI